MAAFKPDPQTLLMEVANYITHQNFFDVFWFNTCALHCGFYRNRAKFCGGDTAQPALKFSNGCACRT
jgi:hypothetical protein